MPELPDLQVFSKNLTKKLAGKKLVKLDLIEKKKLKVSAASIRKSVEGKKLQEVYRSGKELRFKFDEDAIIGLHLMLHGDLHLYEGKNTRKSTIATMQFHDETGLAITDWQGMANLQLNPTDKEGIDALDAKLNASYLEEALQTRAIVKNVLMDQNIIRGIGNAYADEILWEAGISPFSISNRIPKKKIKELAKKIKKVLKDAEKNILNSNPDLISGEVRGFLKIHNAKKKESPGGSAILTKTAGGRKTYYTEEQELYI